MIHPRRHGVSVTARARRSELGQPDIVRLRPHVNLVFFACADGVPAQHHTQSIVTIGEAMRFDLYGFAGDALDGKAAAVDRRQDRVDHRPYSALFNSRRRTRFRRRGRRCRRLRSAGSALHLSHHSKRSTIVARGGRLRFTDSIRPPVLTGTDSTPPRLPQPEPPYSLASVFRISRQTPRDGTPTK